MGKLLRKTRLQRGLKLRDVAAAIGRNTSYVCDVEHGRRGHNMDPVLAMCWAEYLVIDPQVLFDHLGFADSDVDRFRVQHYLQTAAWAHRYTQGRRKLKEALPEIDALWAHLKPGTREKAQASQVRDAIRAALEALRIPRTSKENEQ